MLRVGIIGASGYAGAEIVRIITQHPHAKLTFISSRQFKGKNFTEIYPAMKGFVNLKYSELDLKKIKAETDVVFIALPHKIPMSIIPALIDMGKKVIDLSADFRFSDITKYEEHYQPHTAKKYNDQSVYGLCEVYKKNIEKASLVGNPGCYPTSILLPLIPLLKNRLIKKESIIADSKSGVSGAGRTPAHISHYCSASESFKAYKIYVHRHTPEIEENLNKAAADNISIIFTPHLIPMSRGMLSTIYVKIDSSTCENDIRDCLNNFYAHNPFIRIYSENNFPDTQNVRGTNFCDIGLKTDPSGQNLILISAIDNLVKGAAGQAVQNLNIMYGMDETSGLNNVPYPL